MTPAPSRWRNLAELAGLFLKLGLIGFGGPAAHAGLFEEEFVARRRWLTRQQFLDLFGAAQLIPGPNSTEIALHIGLMRGGIPGLLLAGVGFIGPAVLLSTAFAWVYVHMGSMPRLDAALAGIKPVVVALIAGAMIRLGRAAIRTPMLALIGALALAVAWAGTAPILVLLAGGLGGMLLLVGRGRGTAVLAAVALSPRAVAAVVATAAVSVVSMTALAVAFLQVGAMLYGSGYVLIAFLQDSLVQHHGWLTEQQLLDAIAIGQFTPGPLLSASAFVGYVVGGGQGAAVASVAAFAPSFLYVGLLSRLIPRLRASRWASAFLDAVNAAAVALIGAVALQLLSVSVSSPVGALILVAALAARTLIQLNPMLLVLLGGIAGALLL